MAGRYQITEDEYANAVRFHAWRRFIARPSTRTLVAGGITVVVFGFILWTEPEMAPGIVLGGAALAILLAFLLFVRVPNRARKLYRQYKDIEEPITLELMDAGVKFSNSDVVGILRWSKILQWRQNDRFILIYSMPNLFHVVPKSIAREGFDIALLIQRLVEHVGPER
jgi:hypothetical protein